MNLTKVVSIASLCAVFAVTAAAAQSTNTMTPTKTTTAKATTAKAKTAGDKVAPADLPAAVTDAVMKAHPKATITSAMKVTKGSDVSYSVSIKDGAKTSKVMVAADGTIAPTTMKKKSAKASTAATK